MKGRHALPLLAATLALAAAIAVHPAPGLSDPAVCTAQPGPVTLTATGKVKAGRVQVACPHAWRITEGVMYLEDNARTGGKWIFGGTQTVNGQGSLVIPPFRRDYHECAYWKLRATFADGHYQTGPQSWFCS